MFKNISLLLPICYVATLVGCGNIEINNIDNDKASVNLKDLGKNFSDRKNETDKIVTELINNIKNNFEEKEKRILEESKDNIVKLINSHILPACYEQKLLISEKILLELRILKTDENNKISVDVENLENLTVYDEEMHKFIDNFITNYVDKTWMESYNLNTTLEFTGILFFNILFPMKNTFKDHEISRVIQKFINIFNIPKDKKINIISNNQINLFKKISQIYAILYITIIDKLGDLITLDEARLIASYCTVLGLSSNDIEPLAIFNQYLAYMTDNNGKVDKDILKRFIDIFRGYFYFDTFCVLYEEKNFIKESYTILKCIDNTIKQIDNKNYLFETNGLLFSLNEIAYRVRERNKINCRNAVSDFKSHLNIFKRDK